MGQKQTSHINPKVPQSDGYFEPTLFRAVPWPYSEIGLKADEFALLMFGFLRANNPDTKSHWWSFTKQGETLGLGRSTISKINQLLENSGIVQISRRKGFANIYRFRAIKPEERDVFREIVAEERAKLDAAYTRDGRLKDGKVIHKVINRNSQKEGGSPHGD